MCQPSRRAHSQPGAKIHDVTARRAARGIVGHQDAELLTREIRTISTVLDALLVTATDEVTLWVAARHAPLATLAIVRAFAAEIATRAGFVDVAVQDHSHKSGLV